MILPPQDFNNRMYVHALIMNYPAMALVHYTFLTAIPTEG